MADYDEFAEEYVGAGERAPIKEYATTPTLFGVLGDIEGKSVLDLACGGGYLTRKFKVAGAMEVVGLDISGEMIKIAQRRENENPLGIKYVIGDAVELGDVGKFDIVTAGFLLHYSKTKKEMMNMCEGIYNNLKKGGRLVGVNNNPDSPTGDERRWGSVSEIDEPFVEGNEITITIIENDKEQCSFLNYWWKKETYEECLKAAGFKEVRWHVLSPSKEGVEKYGEEFWEGMGSETQLIIIEALK